MDKEKNDMKKQAFNPYLPSWEYVPDGEPYVFGDRVYVYGSHDKFSGEAFCFNDYVCWSAPINDLGNWKFEGVIYKKIQDPRNGDGKYCMYAPDIVQGIDGKYYLYYGLEMLSATAVAVSNCPEGPYKFYGMVHYKDGSVLGEADGDAYQFDPSVLVDDDGRVYLYTGFGPEIYEPEGTFIGKREYKGGYCVELEADMFTVKEKPVCVIPMVLHEQGTGFENHSFFEASSMRKINGLYYLVYSSAQSHELCYAVSKYPNKDFVYQGTIISNGDVGLNGWTMDHAANYIGNNHGGMVEIEGQWYIFYHRQTNRHSYSRQGCAEPIYFDENGHIAQVEMTSCGLNGCPLAGKGRYSAHIACNLFSKEGASHVELIENFEGHPYFTQYGEDRDENENQYIANMQDGSVAGFKYFNLRETKNIRLELSGAGTGEIVIMSSLDGENMHRIFVGEDKTEISGELQIPQEKAALYFRFEGTGRINFHGFVLD